MFSLSLTFSIFRTALETIDKLSTSLDFTDYSSQIIHAIVDVLGNALQYIISTLLQYIISILSQYTLIKYIGCFNILAVWEILMIFIDYFK